MTLAFDGFNMVARGAITAATCAGLLTDLANASSAIRLAMEADGWTFEIDADTYGVVLTPPASALSDDLRILIAGKDASLGTPTALLINSVTTLDTLTTGELMVGLAGGAAGSYATLNWDDADPVGSVTAGGWFSGYLRGIKCASNGYITMYYSDTAIVIAVDNSTDGSVKYIAAGCLYDPLSTNSGDCEANGYLYGMAVVGAVATTGFSAACWYAQTSNSATANTLFVHGTSSGYAHSVYRDPSTGHWQPCIRHSGGAMLYHTGSVQPKTVGGKVVPLPVPMHNTSSGNFIGILKGMFVGPWTNVRHATASLGGEGWYMSPALNSTDRSSMFLQKEETF